MVTGCRNGTPTRGCGAERVSSTRCCGEALLLTGRVTRVQYGCGLHNRGERVKRTQKTLPSRVAAADWRPTAIQRRIAGHTYAQIGAEFGVTAARAYAVVSEHLDACRKEATERAEELRQIELERLDKLLAVVGPMAEAGDLAAVDRLLRIQERRSAYLGLDAPRAQLVAVDARPDTVRALMALVGNSNSGIAQVSGSTLIDAARDVTPAHAVSATDGVRKPHA